MWLSGSVPLWHPSKESIPAGASVPWSPIALLRLLKSWPRASASESIDFLNFTNTFHVFSNLPFNDFRFVVLIFAIIWDFPFAVLSSAAQAARVPWRKPPSPTDQSCECCLSICPLLAVYWDRPRFSATEFSFPMNYHHVELGYLNEYLIALAVFVGPTSRSSSCNRLAHTDRRGSEIIHLNWAHS